MVVGFLPDDRTALVLTNDGEKEREGGRGGREGGRGGRRKLAGRQNCVQIELLFVHQGLILGSISKTFLPLSQFL